MPRKTVAIVGWGQGRKFPKTGEVWTINFAPPRGARYTRCFQLHPLAGRDYSEDKWLQECDKPVYVIGPKDKKLNPNAVIYPIKQVMALGGPLCSSFDYMMALAMLEGFRRIDLYGISLQQGSPRERLMEHVSLAYWIGLCQGNGIEVRIHGKGILHFPHRYGYDYHTERTYGQRMSFWAALGMLNFKFDDEASKSDPQGWIRSFSPERVAVVI